MLTVAASEYLNSYIFTVNDDTDGKIYVYEWTKEYPEGITVEEYIDSCKRESLLLTEHTITQNIPPTPINL